MPNGSAVCACGDDWPCPLIEDDANKDHYAVWTFPPSQVRRGVQCVVEDVARMARQMHFQKVEDHVEVEGLMSLEESVRASRESRYPNHVQGHTNVGRIWAGILSGWLGTPIDDIPPDIVCLLLAANKMHRAALQSGRGWQDSYVDGRIYIQLAEECADHEVGLRAVDQINE